MRQPGARAAGPASRLCLPQCCGLSEAPAALSPECLIQRTGTTASVCRASLSASLPSVGRRGQITTANTPPIFSSARTSGRRDQPRPTSSHQVFHNQKTTGLGFVRPCGSEDSCPRCLETRVFTGFPSTPKLRQTFTSTWDWGQGDLLRPHSP